MTPPRTLPATPKRTLRPFASGVSSHGAPFLVTVAQTDDDDVDALLRNAGEFIYKENANAADVDRKPARED